MKKWLAGLALVVAAGIGAGMVLFYYYVNPPPANREAQMLKELTEDAEDNWGVERISTEKCVIVGTDRDRQYHRWFSIVCGDHPEAKRISAVELAKDIQEVVSPYDGDYRREYLPVVSRAFARILTTVPAPPDFVGW